MIVGHWHVRVNDSGSLTTNPNLCYEIDLKNNQENSQL